MDILNAVPDHDRSRPDASQGRVPVFFEKMEVTLWKCVFFGHQGGGVALVGVHIERFRQTVSPTPTPTPFLFEGPVRRSFSVLFRSLARNGAQKVQDNVALHDMFHDVSVYQSGVLRRALVRHDMLDSVGMMFHEMFLFHNLFSRYVCEIVRTWTATGHEK